MRQFISLSIFFLPLAISVSAQSLLTYESHAFLSGDQHTYLWIENVEEIDEGYGGTGITWDYSDIIAGDSLISYMLDATARDGHEHFPESNIAVLEEDELTFYYVDQQGLEKHGYLKYDHLFKYDKPVKRFSFPFEYGNSIEGEYSRFRVAAPETVYEGYYHSKIDAYGTLILPDSVRIENVVRVRTSQIYDGTQAGYVSYRWYSLYSDPVLRYPLLSIIKRESANESYVMKAAYYADAEQLTEQKPIIEGLFKQSEFTSDMAGLLKIKAYPNPFIEKFTVEYSLPEEAKVTILVADGLGRLVDTLVDKVQKEGFHSVEFKGKGYFFFYYVTTLVNGRVVSSKKMIHVNR